MPFKILILTIAIFLIFSCAKKDDNLTNIVGTKDFDLSEYSIKPDTIEFVTANPNFFYPFGKYSNTNELEAKQSSFNTKEIIMEHPYGDSTFVLENIYKYINEENYAKLFYDTETNALQLIHAEIKNNKWVVLDSISTGISQTEFLNKYLKTFDGKKQYKVIRISTALAGIIIDYRFENNLLKSITIDSDYCFKKKI